MAISVGKIVGIGNEIRPKMKLIFGKDGKLMQQRVVTDSNQVLLHDFNKDGSYRFRVFKNNKLSSQEDVFIKTAKDGTNETTTIYYDLNYRQSLNPKGDFLPNRKVVVKHDKKGDLAQKDFIGFVHPVYVTQNGKTKGQAMYTDTISIKYKDGKKTGTTVKREENDLGI